MPSVSGFAPLSRRRALLGLAALLAAACSQTEPPGAAATPPLGPEFDRWNQEAQGMLSDVLASLRTFDDFHAFRVTTAAASGLRLDNELGWDPPTGHAWDEATHVTRGFHGRAEQLFQAVTTARIDQSQWRAQREMADATRNLLDLAEVLTTYRAQVDALPPGDAGAALGLLDRAWAQFELVAMRWNMARAQTFAC